MLFERIKNFETESYSTQARVLREYKYLLISQLQDAYRQRKIDALSREAAGLASQITGQVPSYPMLGGLTRPGIIRALRTYITVLRLQLKREEQERQLMILQGQILELRESVSSLGESPYSASESVEKFLQKTPPHKREP